jgi:DNA-binding NarL/FixJ family response regulator
VTRPWDRPDEHDHVLVLADDDDHHRESLRRRLGTIPGRERSAKLGRYPRFRVIAVEDGEAALRRMGPRVTVLAVDLVMPRMGGIEVVEQLRPRRPDIAILAYSASAPVAQAIAAMTAGADHFHQYGEGHSEDFAEAVEHAIDRRRLVRLLERSQLEAETARASLAALGASGLGFPGLRPPTAREAVLPYDEAVRRYLEAAARLFEGDPMGLAERLGISYFALRRLLKRHGVPFPGRKRARSGR